MKKRQMGFLLSGMVMSLCLGGCGQKETGSELLTDTREAVEPVTEKVEPAVETTEEGTRLPVYCGDEQAEHIVRRSVPVEEVTEETVLAELTKALKMDEGIKIRSLSFGMHGGDQVAMLDLNQAFADYLNRLGAAGESIVMGSLTNTFLECYQCDLMMITVEGKVLKTSHAIYEEYLEMYPYTEASYRVRGLELGNGGVKVVCPQIEGLSNHEIQGKWNRIMLGAEERAIDAWEADGTYEVNYEIKTMTPEMLSILMRGSYSEGEEAETHSFLYTYNIDLSTGESIRLADQVDVSEAAENLFAGEGCYVEESLAPYLKERLEAIYENPEGLARSLEGYDYEENGQEPYGYSYRKDGKVWICMEVPHEQGDVMEIELENF